MGSIARGGYSEFALLEKIEKLEEEINSIKIKTDKIGFEFLDSSVDVLEYAAQFFNSYYTPFLRVISVSENDSVPALYSTGLIIGRFDTLSIVFFSYLKSEIHINSRGKKGNWTGWKIISGN